MSDDPARLETELEKIAQAIAAQSGLRGILPEDQIEATLQALHEKQALLQAQLTGSGAIAQGVGNVAAGAGGIAIGGNVYLGPPVEDPAEALTIYRQVLFSACRNLPLRGVDVGASDPTSGQQRLDLAHVYVDLDTKTTLHEKSDVKKSRQTEFMPERETRSLSVLEATIGNRRLVILGDPGSGKSTFFNYLAICLAAHGIDPQAQWLARLPGWPEKESGLIPVHVILRDFARKLPATTKEAEPQHLWDFIVARLEAQNLAFVASPLQQALEQGKAIVLLDGLDEIPTQAQRTLIRDAVAVFAGRYSKSRFAVTCRTLSYQEPVWQLPNFPAFELAPFDEKKIERFIKAWYDELARLNVVKSEEAAGLALRLQEAVRRPDLWRLAPNPLLLTVMALVHTHKGRLPEARALLYEDTMDILLWRWEQLKVSGDDEIPRLRQLLLDAGRTDVDLKRTLWQLAFEAHQQGKATDREALADISEWQLEKKLAELHPEKSRDWAHQVMEAMKWRAGLLLERAPEIYTFPHRTFQEYLAGAFLSAQANFASRAGQLLEAGAFWREVILLAVGRLVYLSGDLDKPLALVGELCSQQNLDNDTIWRKVWLAGEALVEIGPNRVQDSSLGKELAGRVCQRLVDLLEKGRLTNIERAAAGDTLARLGDPREEVMTIDKMQFCLIPAGPFWMGSDKNDKNAYDDEKPLHRYDKLDYDFWMAQYPVSVAQFRAFVEASKHKPENPDSLRDLLNRPVKYVTWHEAVKFCDWLTKKWQREGKLPKDWAVYLPSEAEWEKAARGGLQIIDQPLIQPNGALSLNTKAVLIDNSEPKRRYPWGNEPDANRANYAETKIGATSAVGCFPTGASPYGCEEMSGNVWEWTRSLWGKDYLKPDFKYPYDPRDGREKLDAPDNVARVLRGGAFNSDDRLVRCAARVRRTPHLRGWYIGFRVVVLSRAH